MGPGKVFSTIRGEGTTGVAASHKESKENPRAI